MAHAWIAPKAVETILKDNVELVGGRSDSGSKAFAWHLVHPVLYTCHSRLLAAK